MPSEAVQRWHREIEQAQRRVAPRLPDLDPLELHQILRAILQPPEVPRAFLLKRRSDGGLEL